MVFEWEEDSDEKNEKEFEFIKGMCDFYTCQGLWAGKGETQNLIPLPPTKRAWWRGLVGPTLLFLIFEFLKFKMRAVFVPLSFGLKLLYGSFHDNNGYQTRCLLWLNLERINPLVLLTFCNNVIIILASFFFVCNDNEIHFSFFCSLLFHNLTFS